MKKLIFLLSVIGVLFSCSDSDSNDDQVPAALRGSWKLTKTKADIQNEFTEVKNGKTLEFKNNNEVISDGILCSIGVSPVKNITCIYALESDKEDSTSGLIICSEQTDEYCYDEVYFMINEYGELTLVYPSDEGFYHIYQKK